MKKFEILDHTADIAGRVYGRDLRELFVNASTLLYSLMSPEFRGGAAADADMELSGDTAEDLLVKFLNELIYRAEVKKTAGSVFDMNIEKKGAKFHLSCRIKSREIRVPGREIKAATYHGLILEEQNGVFTADVIFDI
ncbi:MAG: archease [Candidatus Omnitrophica bacterium]|nr:archease [Candidatus Omnitrophota bacterium]